MENNLYTTITTPTRTDPVHNTETLIDHILTTTHAPIMAGTLAPPITDHLPIYSFIKRNIQKPERNNEKTLTNKRYEKLRDEINQQIKTTYNKKQGEHTTNETATQQIKDIQQAIKEVIETYKRRPKQRKKRRHTKYRTQIKEQHKLYRKRKENPTQININKHATCRTRLRKLMREEKRKQFIQNIENTKDNPKQQAKVLKSIIPRKQQNRDSPAKLIYEGKTLTDPTEIANAFNDHFITIGHKTSQKIPKQKEECITRENNHPSFALKPTTPEEVSKVLKKTNPNKASDIYDIKPIIIKELEPFLTPILTRAFNKAIDEGTYPDPLKVTKVIELYKAKGTEFPENYRPISLLPIIAKVFDKIINDQLMAHLIKHNIISPTQYAFRPNSSTTLALQTIIDNLHKNKLKGMPTLAIYIDLSKAYDTVSHAKLLHKLQHDFNFCPKTVAFFKSYLQNRTQTTHTQHATSQPQTITHGIPQGSTLSTTFFLLYINDIINTVPNSKVYTYADDTTLIITDKALGQIQQLAQSELTKLIRYFHANNLVPNPTKTQFSMFHPSNPPICPVLRIQETIIEQAKTAKLLGIQVQENLKHSQTINHIIKKLQPTIHDLRHANKILPRPSMIQLYYSHIYPHLIGEITIWGTEDEKKMYIQPLIRTHKKIVRLIHNKPQRTHTKPLMIKSQLLNLTNLYIMRTCCEIHSHQYPKTQLNRPEHNHNYIWTRQIHEYPTRYSEQKHQYITNPTAHKYSKRHQPTHQMNHSAIQHSKIWDTIPRY